MATCDIDKRFYAKLTDLKLGDKLETDSGFTCMRRGQIETVYEDIGGLFVHCSEGSHYLVESADEDSYLVGFYKV